MATKVLKMQQRSDTSTNWSTANPVLLEGEIGFETDTKNIKIGDGVTAWQSLSYYSVGSSGGDGGNTNLIFDSTPTAGSSNPVTSDGIKFGSMTTNDELGSITEVTYNYIKVVS